MRTLAGVGVSNTVRVGVAVAWLVAAGAAAAGCSNTVDGRALCPGCAAGTEPGFPTGRPTVTPPTTTRDVPLPPPGTLPPSSSGYVYIETKSGLTRCQISAESAGCESEFKNSPVVNGESANGVEVTADGSMRWLVGNLGDIPTTTLDYATYHAVGWTIEAGSDGTRFTNDATGHGMFVSTEGVEVF